MLNIIPRCSSLDAFPIFFLSLFRTTVPCIAVACSIHSFLQLFPLKMVSFKTGGLRLLPAAAALISSAAARCTPCGASDKLLMLFRAQDQSEVAPFCAAFLGTPVSTAEVTVTVTPTTFVSPAVFGWLSL